MLYTRIFDPRVGSRYIKEPTTGNLRWAFSEVRRAARLDSPFEVWTFIQTKIGETHVGWIPGRGLFVGQTRITE